MWDDRSAFTLVTSTMGLQAHGACGPLFSSAIGSALMHIMPLVPPQSFHSQDPALSPEEDTF